MIWRYCVPLVWSFWVHFTCLPLSSWICVVSSWVCLVWILHFVFFLLQPQPWLVFLFLLLQPLHALLLHWCLSVHLPFYVYVLFLIMSAYMRLLLLTPCSVSCLSKDNTRWCFMHIYCYYLNLRVNIYLYVCMIIYTVIVHSSRLNTWYLLAVLIIWCWVY